MESQVEPRWGEFRERPTRVEVRDSYVPRFPLVAISRCFSQQQQRGASLQKFEAAEGTGQVKNKTTSNNISNGKDNIGPPKTESTTQKHDTSDKKVTLQVYRPRPAIKKILKPVPLRNEIVKSKPDSKKGTGLMRVCSRPKKRHQAPIIRARDEVECNFSEQQNVQIDEIKPPDANNQLAFVTYMKNLYNFYQQQQNGAVPDTLYLAVYIIDRYLTLEHVPRRQLLLVCSSALLIGSKQEEDDPGNKVSDFMELSNFEHTEEAMISMEKAILCKLESYLMVRTAYMFLVRFVKAAKADQELENMIYFFGELGLIEYSLMRHCPCMVAAAAVYVAKCTIRKSPVWTDTLQRHTSYAEPELLECAKILVKAHLAALDSTHEFNLIYKKYSLQPSNLAAWRSSTTLR